MTVWYAQLANMDVATANQWNAAPDGSGNWLTWASLGAADILCANGRHGLYITSGFTCAAITTLGNYGGGSGADGGGFYINSGAKNFTLTCDIVAGTTRCLQMNHSSGTVAVVGDVTAGRSDSAHGIHRYVNAGTLTILGDVTGGSSTRCRGLYIEAANSTTVVTGTAMGGTGSTSHGIMVAGANATMTLNGNATGRTYTTTESIAAGVCNNHASGVLTVNGTVSAGTGIAALGAYGQAGAVTVIGSLVDSPTCGAADGKIYWQPTSVAHYWQVAWNGSTNQRYTVPPVQGNVRNGVNYGYYGEALNDGTLVLPAITDVKLGVGYGEDGAEYDGQLVAGGGVPLIGPGGLVG